MMPSKHMQILISQTDKSPSDEPKAGESIIVQKWQPVLPAKSKAYSSDPPAEYHVECKH
jgi:hypothetical protein